MLSMLREAEYTEAQGLKDSKEAAADMYGKLHERIIDFGCEALNAANKIRGKFPVSVGLKAVAAGLLADTQADLREKTGEPRFSATQDGVGIDSISRRIGNNVGSAADILWGEAWKERKAAERLMEQAGEAALDAAKEMAEYMHVTVDESITAVLVGAFADREMAHSGIGEGLLMVDEQYNENGEPVKVSIQSDEYFRNCDFTAEAEKTFKEAVKNFPGESESPEYWDIFND